MGGKRPRQSVKIASVPGESHNQSVLTRKVFMLNWAILHSYAFLLPVAVSKKERPIRLQPPAIFSLVRTCGNCCIAVAHVSPFSPANICIIRALPETLR